MKVRALEPLPNIAVNQAGLVLDPRWNRRSSRQSQEEADGVTPAGSFLGGPMNYQAFTNDSLTMMYEAVRGALAADEALKKRNECFDVFRSHGNSPSGARGFRSGAYAPAGSRRPTRTDLEFAGSTRRVFLLLLSGTVSC